MGLQHRLHQGAVRHGTRRAPRPLRPPVSAATVGRSHALARFPGSRLGRRAIDRPAFDDWLEPANEIRQFPLALAAINRVTEGLRAEVHLHCCHSVFRRQSDVTGDYRPILPLLRDARVDRVNLEFAYPGTGDVGDLELLPEHLDLGMGVVDVRRERVPSVEEIEALGVAGAAIVAPERLALNPDCGFAPDAGEPPTIDEAYEKLSRLVAAARRLRERCAATGPVGT